MREQIARRTHKTMPACPEVLLDVKHIVTSCPEAQRVRRQYDVWNHIRLACEQDGSTCD